MKTRCTINGEVVDCSELTELLLGVGAVFVIIFFIFIIFTTICVALIFRKAGQAWWKSPIPLYNNYILLKIIGRPGWWLVLQFIPFVNFVVIVFIYLDLAKSFDQDELVGILTVFFPFVMLPVFAFSKSFRYVGPGGTPQPPSSKLSETPPHAPTV